MSRGGRNGDIDVYRRLRQIGEGTYGKVYLCEEREERRGVRKQVAIKKVQIAAGKEGFPQVRPRHRAHGRERAVCYAQRACSVLSEVWL